MGLSIQQSQAALNSAIQAASTGRAKAPTQGADISRLNTALAAQDTATLTTQPARAQLEAVSAHMQSAQTGSSLVSAAQQGLTKASGVLDSLRGVVEAIQANGKTDNTSTMRAVNLVGELDRIGQGTNFAGISLLSGAVSGDHAMSFAVGGSNITVDLGSANVAKLAIDLAVGRGQTGEGRMNLSTPQGIANTLTSIAAGASYVSAAQESLSGTSVAFDTAIARLGVSMENISAISSQVSDVSMARDLLGMATGAISAAPAAAFGAQSPSAASVAALLAD
ncbi:MAG: hypothetical protein Q4G30_08190 [Actinomycetaceae bacterium]|nr:hypothetical protein [Actinomycetaceae bacterium]